VLDLCIILAGPTCGRTLAEFGADVIKIDSPHRNPLSSHNDINRGKRSVLLDLKTKEGLDIFMKLVDQADVVLQNFRKGIADQLGVGYEALKKRKPGIIFCSLNTFGQLGPYATRPGHESIAQAISGMMHRFGSEKPALAPFAGNDYGTGLMGAYAVSLALLHKQRTGQGQHVDTALAYTATMLQSALLQGTADKQWNEPRGQDSLGHGPLNRMYKAADAWIYLAGNQDNLRACAALTDLAAKPGVGLAQALEQRIAMRKAAEWEKDLAIAGFGAHRVITEFDELMDSAWAKSRGLSLTREHDVIGPVRTSGPGPKLSLTPLSAGRPASKPGSDAASVLKDIGMDKELDRLVRERVVFVDGVVAG
jgi:crotonobetainyl-CoA:carnitine CoA-transferase CaiB-like acyl-CoA transferase